MTQARDQTMENMNNPKIQTYENSKMPNNCFKMLSKNEFRLMGFAKICELLLIRSAFFFPKVILGFDEGCLKGFTTIRKC